MNLSFTTFCLVAVLPGLVLAQETSVPGYAFDTVSEIGFATTAVDNCAGAKGNDRKINAATTDLMKRLLADGFDPVAIVQFLQTDGGTAEVKKREISLREKHGVDKGSMEALCAAIKAETKSNRALAKMVKIR